MKKSLFLLLITVSAYGQQLAPLTVDKIMRDPKWIGVSPTNIFWSEDSKQVYFNWNPDKNAGDSLYTVSLVNRTPQKVTPSVRRSLPSINGEYNRSRTKKLFEKNGDIFLLDVPTGKLTAITSTLVREFNPYFSFDEKKILYTADQNMYSFEIGTGSVRQWSDFKRGLKKPDPKLSEQDKWLTADQLAHMQIVRERSEEKKAADKSRKADQPKRPKEIYLDDKTVDNIRLSPDEKFITYRLARQASSAKNTLVPNYVTESGFTTDIPSRTKVGASQNTYEFFVYDITRDTVLQVKTNDIAGINDEPDYKKDYPSRKAKDEKSKDAKPTPRPTIFHGPIWSPDGKNAVIVIRSSDNKDRWIMLLDCATQKLTLVDRQRDEAWIGGPATGGFGSFGTGAVGWLNDSKTIWFRRSARPHANRSRTK